MQLMTRVCQGAFDIFLYKLQNAGFEPLIPESGQVEKL